MLVGKQYRLYLKVECNHGVFYVSKYDLIKGNVQGCQRCQLTRQGLIEYKDNKERKLHQKVKGVILRCTNPSTHGYYYYSKIEVYSEWLFNPYKFVDYLYNLPNYFEGATIDRTDNTQGYIPGNIRWATNRQQQLNKKQTITITWNGKEMSLAEFIKHHTPLSQTQGYALYHKGRSLQQLHEHNLSGTGPKKSVRSC